MERSGGRFEHAYVDADGLRLRVGRHGSGPPLFLISGIGAHLDMWAPFAPHAGERELIAFDPPGAGLSQRPRRPSRGDGRRLDLRGLSRLAPRAPGAARGEQRTSTRWRRATTRDHDAQWRAGGTRSTVTELEHPTRAVAWLANALAERDVFLDEGHIILSGARSAAIRVSGGDGLGASLEELGSVSLRVAP